MKDSPAIKKSLIAPCGMNCAICSKYLAYVNKLNKSQCPGCRPGNKPCTYLFKKCSGINNVLSGNATAKFCFECDLYPCKEIERMDKRYKTHYHMSVKENLESIKNSGLEIFVEDQFKRYKCPKCNGLISIHNKKCFKCSPITKLVEK